MIGFAGNISDILRIFEISSVPKFIGTCIHLIARPAHGLNSFNFGEIEQ